MQLLDLPSQGISAVLYHARKLQPADTALYTFKSHTIRHQFCKTCGCHLQKALRLTGA
jgi:hypothetical protein